jgi:hypothetical protein
VRKGGGRAGGEIAMNRAKLSVLAVAGAFAVAGCYRTTVRSGNPPGPTAPGYDEHWHSGYLAGAVEGSGPYALDRICPAGWAEVKAKTDPLDTLLTVITLTIYTPQLTTIVCAEPGAPDAPPVDGYRLPAPVAPSAYPPALGSGFPPPPPVPETF